VLVVLGVLVVRVAVVLAARVGLLAIGVCGSLVAGFLAPPSRPEAVTERAPLVAVVVAAAVAEAASMAVATAVVLVVAATAVRHPVGELGSGGRTVGEGVEDAPASAAQPEVG
jgi:hypothetical protein